MKSMLRLLVLIVLLAGLPQASFAQADNLQKYVTEEFVAGFVSSPARLLKSSYAKKLIDAADQDEQFAAQMLEVKGNIGVDPREASEVIMLLDRRTILQMAGLPEDAAEKPAAERPAVNAQLQKNNMKQIALAFHNFHDVYNHFVDDDGHAPNGKGNLSWRVHLLPFLEHAPLYEKFRLNEPWDSEHNKALIPQMPRVFRCNGVEDKGKTSVHVLTSKGTLFGGDNAPRIRDITDGTSNTILTVVAGSDKADFWTKPGGLELKDGEPKNTLGNFGDRLMLGLADGSVRHLPVDLDAQTFHNLATRAGGEIVEQLGNPRASRKPRRLPSWIVRTNTDIDQAAVRASLQGLGESTEWKVGQHQFESFGEYAIAFPDSKTLVAAPMELLLKMLNATTPADTNFAKRLASIGNTNDFTLVADLEPITVLKNQLAGNIPMAGIVQAIEEIQASFDVSGSGTSLQNITAKMQNEISATQLSGLLMGLMQMQRAQLMQMGNSPNSPIPPDALKAINVLFERTEVKADGVNVSYGIPKPEDMDAFAEELIPVVRELFSAVTQARSAARRTVRKNALKQIGLAFHNYNDVYGALPRHGSDADARNKGLSWRVHLLPFLDQAPLYKRFKLDEAWDSEHNLKLVPEMPDVFKVEGVDPPGHTSVHVFIGKKAPFGDGSEKTRFRDFLDGMSNTLLVVEAGPNTADVWTKPGGLEFTGENSIKLLGNIGDTFNVLMTDGSVRTAQKDIEANLLNNLIQHNDGNPVDF